MRVKKILRWFIPTLVIAGLAYLLGYSNVLVIHSININQVGQSSEVINVLNRPTFHIQIGGKLARANTKGAENELGKISWVAKAKVNRNWISRNINVSIFARKPVAVVQGPSQVSTQYIDSTGVIYSSNIPNLTLPAVQLANQGQSGIAADFIAKSSPVILEEMQLLSVDDAGNLKMQIQSQGASLEINWGADQDISIKTSIFNKLIALPENKKISSIDLSDPKYPVVKN
jgi:cell division septal protein FtsQ